MSGRKARSIGCLSMLGGLLWPSLVQLPYTCPSLCHSLIMFQVTICLSSASVLTHPGTSFLLPQLSKRAAVPKCQRKPGP
eukprot:5614727-Amphidinium_carterae.1